MFIRSAPRGFVRNASQVMAGLGKMGRGVGISCMRVSILMALAVVTRASAQAECDGWGEFRGIRVDGELMPFASSVRGVSKDEKQLYFSATQKISNPRFSRNGDTQTSSATISNSPLSYTHTVQDVAPGTARVTVVAIATRAMSLAGTYYYVNLPFSTYGGGSVEFVGTQAPAVKLGPLPAGGKYATMTAKAVRVSSPTRTIELTFESPVEITAMKDVYIDTDYVMQEGLRLPADPKKQELVALYFPLAGDLSQGQMASATFTIKASGSIDRAPVKLTLDASHPGPGFDGAGGNFRIQSAQDQAHLAYNLENLRVAWGRVEMPLAAWQPQENAAPAPTTTPATSPARGGRGAGGPANTSVQQAMQMARTLADRKIPIVISAWSAPAWALGPSERKADQPPGIQAGRLNPEKLPALYKAIGSYLAYLKSNYGAQPLAFSFNESDLGINVLFTPQEHAEFIKGLGRYLEEQGLKTRMLLGDACSPHPVKFIDAAMNDPECAKYIAAVSFHSWHDGTPEEFAAWGQAAQKLHVPVICGEGGTDADAYRYTQIFAEPWFCLNEIDTYLQMMQYAQVASVLHWQLTENYSVLANRGGTLAPTRRFYHLKQLNLTPAGAPFLPLLGNAPAITHAAYGDPTHGYALHLLNNAAARQVSITGLPATLHELRAFATDAQREMKELDTAPVSNGTATVTLDQGTLLTLIGR